MTTFIALYRGHTIDDARLLAASADPSIVSDFATRLINRPVQENDPALRELGKGRRRALKIIQKELNQGVYEHESGS